MTTWDTSVAYPPATQRSKTTTPRKRGSLVDAVTLADFPFQFEPSSHVDKNSTHFGEQHIVGHQLSNFHWVGGGKNEVDLSIHLVGAALTAFSNPTPNEVGNYRVAQLANYQRVILTDSGDKNEDGSPRMIYIKNPEPPPVVDTVAQAKEKIKANKKAANQAVMTQINNFKSLTVPQDDIGAPHPVLINMGSLYTGKQFLLLDVEVTYMGRNMEDLNPYEATLKLKFTMLGDKSKYSGSGAKR